MNRTLAILLLLTIAGAAFAQVSRPITQINDVTALDPYAEAMEFWQGDTVQYDVYARDGRTAMQYTGDVFAVWMVAARTNYGTVYMISTGTVASATNGHLRINAARAQTLLPATNYWSQVRVFRIADAVTQELSVAAWNILTVRESIDVSASEYADPIPAPWTITVNITNNYGDVTGGNITNIVAGTNISIRAGGGPQVTVDFDRTGIATGTPVYSVAGLATGTPLYAYSETDPIFLSQTGTLWDAINGKQSYGSYATGTPLYVETYLGTITGGTITTGATASVTTNGGMLEIVYVQGAAGEMDYPAVEGASNLALAAYALASNATIAAGAAGVLGTNNALAIATVGAYATNSALAPYTLNIPAGTTATITRAMGPLIRADLTNSVHYIAFDSAFDASVSAWPLVELVGTNSVIFVGGITITNYITASGLGLSTGAVPVLFRKPYGSTVIKGIQLSW